MSVEDRDVGGGSAPGPATPVEVEGGGQLQLKESTAGEQQAEQLESQTADKQQASGSDDNATQTPSKLSSASSTGSLKKLSAKAKGECSHGACSQYTLSSVLQHTRPNTVDTQYTLVQAFVPTPSPPPAAAGSRSKPLLPTSASQQQHANPFTAATSLYTDSMPPANPESVAYFKPIVQSLLSTDHLFTDALLLKAMLLDPLQQRCIPMSVLAHHPVLVNDGTMPIVPWDILHIVRNTPGWTISADMSIIRHDAIPVFDHRQYLEQSVYIQMPKSIHLQDLHSLMSVINTVPGVQALQAYPASLLLSVSNGLLYVDRRQDGLTLDTKTRDAFVVLQDVAMVKILLHAIDQAKSQKKSGKQPADKSQPNALPSNLAGVLPHMNASTKAEHLLTLVNNARNEQRKQSKPKPAARRQKASGEANDKIDNWRSASPAPMEEDKQADVSDDAGQQICQLLVVDQSALIAAAALNRPSDESKQSAVVAPPSQAAIARKKLYTLTKDNKSTTSNFAIGSDDDRGFAAESRLRSKLLLRAVAQPSSAVGS